MKSNVKKLFLGTNLKMYKTVQQTVEYFQSLHELTRDIPPSDVCLFAMASYPGLYTVSSTQPDRRVLLGAQDLFWEEAGPYTGAVSPAMLAECGIQVVQIGHSERRQHFGETDRTVNKKVLASLEHEFITLICVGETLEEKNWNVTTERLRQQVKIALHGVEPDKLAKIWLAYEPVWAIGESGIPANPEYANCAHQVIREVLVEKYTSPGKFVPLLYGGSVNPDNAPGLIVQSEIDGLYIGRSAWQADQFNALIRQVYPVWMNKDPSN